MEQKLNETYDASEFRRGSYMDRVEHTRRSNKATSRLQTAALIVVAFLLIAMLAAAVRPAMLKYTASRNLEVSSVARIVNVDVEIIYNEADDRFDVRLRCDDPSGVRAVFYNGSGNDVTSVLGSAYNDVRLTAAASRIDLDTLKTIEGVFVTDMAGNDVNVRGRVTEKDVVDARDRAIDTWHQVSMRRAVTDGFGGRTDEESSRRKD